jgi:hypothetical protein
MWLGLLLLGEEVEDIFFALGLSEELSGIAILHFILMKSGDLNLD